MINIDDQINLFKTIGIALKEKVECIVIGGSAMMFYNAKSTTKDIDLVFLNKKDLIKVKEVLYDMGFDEKKKITIFKHYEEVEKKPILMEGKDIRFDLFNKQIICFEMSESILSRIKEVHDFGNLVIKVISPEDIILLKCATDRERDRIDALELIKKFNIDWNIIIKESVNQIEIGEIVFPVYLYDFLLELKDDLKADISKKIIIEVRKIAEKEMIKILKKKRIKS